MDPKLMALAEQLQAKVPAAKIEALINSHRKTAKVFRDGRGQAFTWGPQGLVAAKASGMRYKAPEDAPQRPLDSTDQQRLAELETRVDELAEELDGLYEVMDRMAAEAKAAEQAEAAAPEVPATKARRYANDFAAVAGALNLP